VSGGGSRAVFSRADNNSYKAVNRIQAAGGRVSAALEEFTLAGTRYPAGTFIVDRSSISGSALRDIASTTHIDMTGGAPNVRSSLVPTPRIGLYQSWVASMDAGWSKLLFDEYDFPYEDIHDADVRVGQLKERFDVIVLPDMSPQQIIEGHAKGTMPPDYVGGMTEEGMTNLKRFVQDGGTLVCNKTSLELALTLFDLPIENSLRGVSRNEFFVPGSILRMDYDASHPLAYGMEPRSIGYISGQYALEVASDVAAGEAGETGDGDRSTVHVVARFPDEPLLLSGFLAGEERLHGKASVIEAEVGQGRVILFAFNVQNRAQAHATHKLLYNAIFGGSR
jgi:hypothetical protein